MFEVEFDAIKEEERRQKGLKRKQKKEKAPFDEVSNDDNPFGRRRGSYIEAEIQDAPVDNIVPPNIPSYIPKDRLEDDYFKSRSVDTRDYPERDVKGTVQNVANTSKQVTSIAGVIIMLISIMIGVTVFLVTRFTMNNSSRSSNTSSQTESPVRSKGGSSFEPELEYYELCIQGTRNQIEDGDSVNAGDRLHFKVVLSVTNPNPDEWDTFISIRVNGAKLVEDTRYMNNVTLKDFDKSYQNALYHHNDIDYNKKYTFAAKSTTTLLYEFSFDVLSKDELSIKVGSDMMAPYSAASWSNLLKVSFPII